MSVDTKKRYNTHMLKQLLASAMLATILLPLSVSAAEPAPTSDPAVVATTPAPTPDGAPSAALGPQSTTNAGGSALDAGTLQSGGISPLQSATSDAAGLTAPSNVLQAPITSDANLKVLAGEADGAPVSIDDSPAPTWPWALAAILLAAIIGGSIVYRDRRRFGRNHP